MTAYVNPFTSQTISPSQVAYESLSTATSITLNWPINGTTSSNVAANITEITATASGVVITMPPAIQVSVGQAIIIKNTGSTNSFNVVDNGGGAIVTVATTPGANSYYIYVTNNTTTAGTWSYVAMGLGSFSVQTSSIAGYGLVSFNNQLNTQYPITTISSNTQLTYSNRANFYVWTGGAGTITLPTSANASNNWFVIIKNNGTGILTINPYTASGDTIDNNTSQQLQLTESLVIVSNGSNAFDTFGYGRSNAFAFTELSVSVSGLSTLSLTSAQASNTIQQYVSATSACTVTLPRTVQLYTITNTATNTSYTLTFTTGVSGGQTVTVPANSTSLLVCDGTNVYNANTVNTTSATTLTLSAGSASAPSLNVTGGSTTGIYFPSTSSFAITLSGVSSMTLSSLGVQAPIGISGGTF